MSETYRLPLTPKAAEDALLRLVRLKAKELGLSVQELSARIREAVAGMRGKE